jgi:hypothetical protein
MIDMKCPSCGAGGRVPREKVNTRLVCKKCLRVFHITASGNTVLGEPAAPKDAPTRGHSPREAARQDTVERFDDVASKLSSIKLPQFDPKVLGAIAGVVLLAALGFWFFSKQSLERRSQEIAKSFVKSDMKTAVDLSLPGTEMDTIRWYADVFKQYNELKLLFGGQEAGVVVQIEGAKGETVPVKLIFSKEGMRFDGSLFADIYQPNPNLNKGKSALELPLFWTKDMWGNWLLDGSKTYAGTATP